MSDRARFAQRSGYRKTRRRNKFGSRRNGQSRCAGARGRRCHGDREQTFHGDVSGRAGALCLWRHGRIQWRDVVASFPVHAGLRHWQASGQFWNRSSTRGERAGVDETWPERLIIASRAIWFYLGKLAWPHPLIFIYPRWEIKSVTMIAYCASGRVAGMVVLWLTRWKWKRSVFFAVAYYVISLFPVLGFSAFISSATRLSAIISNISRAWGRLLWLSRHHGGHRGHWMERFLQRAVCGILYSCLAL